MNINRNVLSVDRISSFFKEEQRTRPREEIHAGMLYQIEDRADVDNNKFHEGVLHNISETGALISCSQNLAAGSRIIIVVTSDNPDEHAIHIIGTIVRRITEPGVDLSCYGCRIERICDPN